MAKIFRVDMETLQISSQKTPGEYEKVGGRAFASMVIGKEVYPACHPLGKHNKLILAPGLLGGTGVPSSGRLSVAAKSPLTETINEANVGGTAASYLGRLGVKAIIIEGLPREGELYLLKMNKEGLKVIPANEYKGLGNYELVQRLRKVHGDGISVISIGPAGDMKMAAASVAVTDQQGRPSHHAGRGGMGAVMGSKGVKAIIIDNPGAQRIELKDKEAFSKANSRLIEILTRESPMINGLHSSGTPQVIEVANMMGSLPTKNRRYGSFDKVERITSGMMEKLIKERGGRLGGHACMPGCLGGCAVDFVDKDGEYLTSALEFETITLLGANLEIDDIDAIATMDYLCDDFGLDTIEMGNALAVAAEAGIMDFGDPSRAVELIKEVGKGTILGRILGQGAVVTGKVFGITRVPAVKGLGFPAWEPRAFNGAGVTYATSPQGSDHTCGYSQADPQGIEGQAKRSRDAQVSIIAMCDSPGFCFFPWHLAGIPVHEYIFQLISAQYGFEFSQEEALNIGKEVLKIEKTFNEEAGFSKGADRLPEFILEEPLPPHNSIFNVPKEEIDKVFDFGPETEITPMGPISLPEKGE
ncbi:MAG: aldehyde ferredoxin oxidoreductase C-terminal domain-containing protein [Thermodesulfobacteriota bacterium]|nr:aldehyde ferredoxin oxidoreductase C-terminal domain-containing protein [Thermodesulfobacteriota bacterium]